MSNRWNQFKNRVALKLKMLGWKLSGSSVHSTYERLQVHGSAHSREDEDNQRDIQMALESFYRVVPDKSAKILDAGCGDGWTLDRLREMGYNNLIGVDIYDEKLETARTVGKHQVQKAILPDLPFEDNKFDVVYNRHVLQHILYPQKMIESFHRVLKTGGILFLVVPQAETKSNESEAHVTRIRSLKQIEKRVRSAGFKILSSETHELRDREFWIVAEKEKVSEDPGIRARTVKSVGVMGVLQAFRGVVGFAVTILLYRLLMAKDFGLFALCEACLAFLFILSDMGIESVMIQKPGRNVGEILQSGFVVRTFFALICFLAVFFGANLFAFFARSQELANPLRIVSITLLLNLIAFKPAVSFQKNIQFEKLIIPEIVSVFSSAAISLTMAVMGYGYWSLIWATVISQALRAVCFTVLYPQPLFEPWKKQVAIDLLKQGRFSFLYAFLAYFLSKMIHLIVGRVFGIAVLGFYYLAFNWANLVVTRVVQLVGQVVFPAFAKIESDRERVIKVYYEYLEHISLLAAPFATFMVVISPLLIPGILGSKWEPAVFLCQIMCFHGFFRALTGAGLNVLLSLGFFKKLTHCLIIECCLFLICVYPAIKVIGIVGVAYVVSFAKMVSFLWVSVVLNAIFKDRFVRVLQQILPSLSCASLMGGILWFCREMLTKTTFHPIMQIIVLTVLALISYVAFFVVLFPSRRQKLYAIWNDLWMRLTSKGSVPAAGG